MASLTYAVLGAGRQGLAAALDFALHGDAARILLGDRDLAVAEAAAARLDELAGRSLAEPLPLDGGDETSLARILEPADAALSGLPYALNPGAAAAACRARTHFVDLGGNSAISAEVLALDAQAREAGVTLVPDCGLAPGLTASLTAFLFDAFDEPQSLQLRCGGLPQEPQGPLDYQLVFSIGGLTNEYLGEAELLRDGEIVSVPTLSEWESLDFAEPVGACEAFTTSGGTSTLPASYLGRLANLDYKTVRYPGHCAKIAAMRDLGLLSDEPVDVPGGSVRPRDVFHAVAGPALDLPGRDLIVLRAEMTGVHGGKAARRRLDVLDFEDEKTGLTAMQRMTGFPAAMVLEALARGEAEAGATPLESVLPAGPLIAGLAARGIRVEDRQVPLD